MASENDRETLVYAAELAEQTERFKEMVDAMKKVAAFDEELTIQERNLFSFGYKNIVGKRRSAWRILSSLEQKEESRGNDARLNQIKEYRQKVEEELSTICDEVTTLVDEHLLPSCSIAESTVFYQKMKGDYYRYLAEFKAGIEKKEVADKALKAYAAASESATELNPAHPTRLSLALNYSVFHYEIMKSPERARHLAKKAFDESQDDLDTLSEESYEANARTLRFLWDNVTLWTSEITEDEDKKMETSQFCED